MSSISGITDVKTLATIQQENESQHCQLQQQVESFKKKINLVNVAFLATALVGLVTTVGMSAFMAMGAIGITKGIISLAIAVTSLVSGFFVILRTVFSYRIRHFSQRSLDCLRLSQQVKEAIQTQEHIGKARNKRRWSTALKISALVLGGALVFYLISSSRSTFPIHDSLPKTPKILKIFQPQSPSEKLASCIIEQEKKHLGSRMLRNQASLTWKVIGKESLKCNKIINPNFNVDEIVTCRDFKKIFRKMTQSIHADKFLSEENKFLSHSSKILNRAYTLALEKLYCSDDARMAQCVISAAKPVSVSSANEVFDCVGKEIPRTCANLDNYVQDLTNSVKRNFPKRLDLLRKIAQARAHFSCVPLIPSFMANLFGWWK